MSKILFLTFSCFWSTSLQEAISANFTEYGRSNLAWPVSKGQCRMANEAGIGTCYDFYDGLSYCPPLNMSFTFGSCANPNNICCFLPVKRQREIRTSGPLLCGVRFDESENRLQDPLPVGGVADRFARILGGSVLHDPIRHCWIAAIFSDSSFVGSGVLLNSRWVATTATSLIPFLNRAENGASDSSSLLLRLGQADLSSLAARDVRYRVRKLIVHPEFKFDSLGIPKTDIALLQLTTDMNFTASPSACGACLPLVGETAAGESCLVAGYGVTQPGGKVDGKLREVEVNVFLDESCQLIYRNYFGNQSFTWDSGSLCAGGEAGKDTCNRDGGAPLHCSPAGDIFGRVAGLASWGIGCGRNGLPSSYTDLSDPAIREWITATAGSSLPQQS